MFAAGPTRHSQDVRYDGGYQGVSGRHTDMLGARAFEGLCD